MEVSVLKEKLKKIENESYLKGEYTVSVSLDKLFQKEMKELGYTYNGTYTKSLHDSGEYRLSPKCQKFPYMVIALIGSKCNSKCPSCPYTNHPDIRKKFSDVPFMEWSTWTWIARECGLRGAMLRITSIGEPTLHPKLAEMVSFAKKCGCKVGLITNGSNSVSDIDADIVEFSVDAGTKEEYERVRPGLNWETLNMNVKKAKGQVICSIVNQTGVDIERAVKYWTPFAEKVQLRKFLTYNGKVPDRSADKTPFLKEGTPCPWLFDRTVIDPRGDVTFCACDSYHEHSVGNVNDMSIVEMWQGEKYKWIRKMHIEKKQDKIPLCKGCEDLKYRTWGFSYRSMVE